jgi:hypothetical protein
LITAPGGETSAESAPARARDGDMNVTSASIAAPVERIRIPWTKMFSSTLLIAGPPAA